MERVYSLSKLFKETEFDVQKGCNRYGSRETFFSVLNRFTLDAEMILTKYSTELRNGTPINMDTLERDVERLQRMLANIGAVNLAMSIQSLSRMLEKKLHDEYMSKLGEVLANVGALRVRIINAEMGKSEYKQAKRTTAAQAQAPSSPVEQSPPAAAQAPPPIVQKHIRHVKPRRVSFEKLLLLIENLELESALDLVHTIMQYSYTDKIDEALSAVAAALEGFNHEKALSDARRLMGMVIYSDALDKSAQKVILAIDDMPDALRTVKSMLKDKYSVVCVTDYESAMKFLRSNTPDLILMDIEMPGMDGFVMMQLFRKLPEYDKVPIVFLTSNASSDYVDTAMGLGAQGFIKKPVDMETLITKLDDVVLQFSAGQ